MDFAPYDLDAAKTEELRQFLFDEAISAMEIDLVYAGQALTLTIILPDMAQPRLH